MKILIACEYSGTVRDAFSVLGHDVTSCDLLPSEKEGKHYQGNIFDILYQSWDVLIAFPPCTYLTVSGNRWFKEGLNAREGVLTGLERQKARQDALSFVKALYEAPIKHIAIENPIGVLSTAWRKPDQIVNPFQFGDGERKATCLWLKNLPLLVPTCEATDGYQKCWKMGPSADRAKERARFPKGFAKAMAGQWTEYLSKI